jgi:polysaccharide export outer membrane protein
MNKIKFLNFRSSLLVLMLVLVVSCVPYKEIRYFNDINETKEPVNNPREQKRISPFDNIYIKVLSTDEKTAQIFNSTDPLRTDFSTSLISYLVDEKGNIDFPFVGDINIGGLTTSQASSKIQKALSEYIANTAVIVKYIENKITVMGEVEHQGVYPFTDDKLNIYQAVSLAGGLTRYGNHKNVTLIRQVDNKIMQYKLDLSNSKIISSEFYYILPNDIVVIEPLRSVSRSYQNMTYGTILTTITTLIAVLYLFNVRL